MAENVELKGFNELIKKLTKLGENVPKLAKGYMIKTAESMRNDMIMSCRQHFKSQKGLTRSIVVEKLDVKNYSVRIGTAINYAPYLEYGTLDSVPYKGIPPYFEGSPLQRWVQLNLTPNTHVPKSKKIPWSVGVAYLIARKIAKHGLRPKPFVRPAWEKYGRDFSDNLKWFLKERLKLGEGIK